MMRLCKIIKMMPRGEYTITIKHIYHNTACNRYCEIQKENAPDCSESRCCSSVTRADFPCDLLMSLTLFPNPFHKWQKKRYFLGCLCYLEEWQLWCNVDESSKGICLVLSGCFRLSYTNPQKKHNVSEAAFLLVKCNHLGTLCMSFEKECIMSKGI